MSALHCLECGAPIAGHLNLGVFGSLSAEQLAFAELSNRCEGKITRVEDELGLSYETVRVRLDELIRALGYSVREPLGPSAEERRSTLERLSFGDLSPDEAIELRSVK